MMPMVQSAVSESNLDDLVRLALTAPPGPIAEVGVWQGGSALRLYHEVCIPQGRTLHLFDSWRGMPVHTNGLDSFRLGSFAVDRDVVNRLREWMPLAQFHQGTYPSTHPADLADIAFIHCDCDQYLSYRAVIDNMWPLVVPDGMMLFDDFPYLAGAKLAVDETFLVDELFQNGEHFYVKKPSLFLSPGTVPL